MDTTCEHSRSWYLVQCKPRQDERAEEHLTRQGYTCYRPRLTLETLSQGRKKLIQSSLFPGYLFIRLGQHDDWSPLRSTRGVSRIVRFGNHPAPVPDLLVDRLRQHEATQRPSELFTTGDSVRITDGAFSDIEAIFVTMDGDERVVLLLNLLQREQRVTVPVDVIRKS